jgi:hypothetical protein
MSTEHIAPSQTSAEPVNADVAFEPRDFRAKTIYVYLGVLALAVGLTYLACVYILRATVHEVAESDTPPPPIRAELGSSYQELPPEPRLQGVPGHPTDPQLDRRLKFEMDNEALEKAGWLDQKEGIAQIPIQDAMKVIAEKGWPGAAATPAEKKK